MTPERRPPLAFVDEDGQAGLDVDEADVGSHFILTAVLVEEPDAGAVRTAVEAVRAKHVQTGELRSRRLARSPARFRQRHPRSGR